MIGITKGLKGDEITYYDEILTLGRTSWGRDLLRAI